jgi:hypothetical protein
LRVIRDIFGKWTLLADKTGSSLFIPQGSVIDNTINTTSWIGIVCNYANSYSKSMYYDDIYVRNYVPDKSPPKITSIESVNDSTINVSFNEALDTTQAQNINNYVINNGIKSPNKARVIEVNKVQLSFLTTFQQLQYYQLISGNQRDLFGNGGSFDSLTFRYNTMIESGLAISEIYPDSIPSYGLPLDEYMELVNYSTKSIDIGKYYICDKSDTVLLKPYQLYPDSFVILINKKNEYKFSEYYNKSSIDKLPSLNNSGDVICLLDSQKRLVDKARYNLNSYQDRRKQNGGFSLERYLLRDTCLGEDNWYGSNDSIGGTPGRVNSNNNRLKDVVPPNMTGYEIIDSQTLKIYFSERIDLTTLLLSNISLDSNTVVNIIADSIDKQYIICYLQKPILKNVILSFNIKQISDCEGNLTQKILTKKIVYIDATTVNTGDIIISEVMSNPLTNNQILPFREFIELHNISQKPISLKKWSITDASLNKINLSDYILLPDSYLVLTSILHQNVFQSIENVYYFPSLVTLNDNSDSLLLKDSSNKTIHSMFYEATFHETDIKRLGGWSLELSSKRDYCISKGNYLSSQSNQGATPGKINSIQTTNNIKIDNNNLVRWKFIDAQSIQLFFSYPVSKLDLIDISKYNTSNGLIIDSLTQVNEYQTTVLIQFKTVLDTHILYQLKLVNVSLCNGYKIDSVKLIFGVPKIPTLNNLLFNELLAKSSYTSNDFFELYNNSNKIIDLQNLYLSYTNDLRLPDKTMLLYPQPYYLLPDSYVALATNRYSLKLLYPSMRNTLENKNLPSITEDVSYLTLKNIYGVLIDSFHYKKAFHNPFLYDINDYSLEKINPTYNSLEAKHWTSASTQSERGTPGYQNSQYQLITDAGKPKKYITLSDNYITPNNDGYQDKVQINYSLPVNGCKISIKVFSSKGLIIRTLPNEIASKDGYLYWYGEDDKQQKVAPDNYILLFEAVSPSGEVYQEKKAITLYYD